MRITLSESGVKSCKASMRPLTRFAWLNNFCKISAESFKNESHLNAIVSEAQKMVNGALAESGDEQ